MLAVLFAHAVATALAPLLVYRWGRKAFYPLALVPLGSLIWVAQNWPGPGQARSVNVSWVPELSMDITLRFDALAAIMSVLVLGIGALVLFYCADYFHHHDGHAEKRLPSFAAELVAFSGAMFGLVVSDNMLVLYVFWELTTVLSFLLVGHYAERASSRKAAVQALLVTTAGGLAMLVGIIVLGTHLGHLPVVRSDRGAADRAGGVGRHRTDSRWRTGEVGDRAAALLAARCDGGANPGERLPARRRHGQGGRLPRRPDEPGFADSPPWRPMVITLGVVTVLLAGWRAVREYDLKLILAFGTVSQLGFITVMVGAGGSDLMLAGLALLCAHAMFKAALFMVVGIIDHTTGTRDIRRLAWLGHASLPLLVIAVGATASMAALPPFLGFVAKEADYETLLHSESLGALRAVRAWRHRRGSVFTTMYSLRFLWGAFAKKGRTEPSKRVAAMHAPPVTFLARACRSSPRRACCSGCGRRAARQRPGHLRRHDPRRRRLRARALARLQPAAAAVGAGAGDRHRRVLRPVTARRAEAGVSAAGQRRPHLRRGDPRRRRALRPADRHHAARLDSRNAVGDPVDTGASSRWWCWRWGRATGPEFALWGSPLQVIVGLLILAAAVGATVMRNRLAAVLLVGVTGYGCGTIFAFHGAPDLALTQFLVETLTLVIFVLVLRTLPAESDRTNIRRHRLPRAALALAVGASVTTLAAFAMAARTGVADRRAAARRRVLPRTRRQHRQRAAGRHPRLGHPRRDLGAAGGRDRRGVNGVPAQAFRRRAAGRRRRPARHRSECDAIATSPAAGDITWLRGSELRDPRHRSLVLEVATRMIFPLIMVLSAYFFFAGHNTPGGGFAGGLTAGLALVLRYLAGGRYELGETLPLDAGKILGTGLALSAGTAVASLLLGAPVLSSAVLQFDIPVLGHIKLVTALFFDLGVYLIVVGLVLDVLRSLGARVDVEMAEQRPAAVMPR